MLSDFKIAPSESGQWQVRPAGRKNLEGHPRGPGHVPLRAPCLRSAGLDRLPGKHCLDPARGQVRQMDLEVTLLTGSSRLTWERVRHVYSPPQLDLLSPKLWGWSPAICS